MKEVRKSLHVKIINSVDIEWILTVELAFVHIKVT